MRRWRLARMLPVIAAAAIGVTVIETAFLVHEHLTSVRVPIVAETRRPADCVPGDQDAYVWSPDRLHVLSPCLRVAGLVQGIIVEQDGDRHLNIDLDPQYEDLLTPGNKAQSDRLVVEPICVDSTDNAVVAALCARDPDPVKALPKIGERVWLEGRYVVDSNHYYWAELHPLYRWGPLP